VSEHQTQEGSVQSPAQRRDALVGRIFSSCIGFMELLSIHVGDRLGFYEALVEDEGATASQLADATGTNERYAREWLEQQAVAGILEVDDADAQPEERRYRLPEGHDEVLLERDSKVDFLRRQVLTSRNVIAHPITDFWYGGLNYQIEHHLFPRLPRNKLREAQPIIRGFCRDHSIAYHETSVLQSYKEILQHLHEVGAPLREARKAR
jgi:hypothetical protein